MMQRCPSEFALGEQGAGFVCGQYCIDSPTAVRATKFAVRITVRNDSLEVAEQQPGTQLPKACPERHINPDHTFCLGLNAGVDLATLRDFDDWWLLLEQFLRIQLVAERTRRWPSHQMLSHGTAGVAHARAVSIAARLGIGADYECHLAGSRNWITDLVDDYEQQRSVGSRKSLPVIHLTERVIKRAIGEVAGRRQYGKLTQRKRRRLIRILAAIEWKRAKQERAFWQEYRVHGVDCCDTMINCPLRSGLHK